jgi:hypothetical protein
MKDRAAVELSIGHLKHEHRLVRNRLKVVAGGAINAILNRLPHHLSSSACEDPYRLTEIDYFRIDQVVTHCLHFKQGCEITGSLPLLSKAV